MKGLLRILSGEGERGTIDLETGSYAIGREESVEIQINSKQVSRRHAQLVVDKDHTRIIDKGSSNGTLVNGSPIRATKIEEGDQIQIGDVIFEFHRKQPRPQIQLTQADREAHTIKKHSKPIQHDDSPQRTITPFLTRKDHVRATLLVLLLSVLFGGSAYLAGASYRSMVRGKLREAGLQRAQNIVRYFAEKNREDLRLGNELLLDVDTIEREKGVREAFIINAKGRVLAPSSKLAQLENDPFTIEALSQQNDRIILPSPRLPDGTHILVHPIRAYNDKAGMYVTLGVAKIVFSPEEAVGALPEMNRLILLMVLAAVALAAIVAWLLPHLHRRSYA